MTDLYLHELTGIMPDVWIRHMAKDHAMIEPFVGEKVRFQAVCEACATEWNPSGPAAICPHCSAPHAAKRAERVVSYGLSSMGYDLRCADEFKVFTNVRATMLDPKNLDASAFVNMQGAEYCIIPPNSFALSRSVERFKLPHDVLMVVLGKSTYARVGIVVDVTPGEPGWEGHLTLEISNTTPLPAKVYANEGLCQCLFFKSGVPCVTPYGDGKYQRQGPEIVLPR